MPNDKFNLGDIITLNDYGLAQLWADQFNGERKVVIWEGDVEGKLVILEVPGEPDGSYIPAFRKYFRYVNFIDMDKLE